MRGVKAKRLRREAKERGEFKPKQFFKPLTITIKGKEVYIPRRERRMLMRKFLTDVKKGRINLNDRQTQG